MNKKVLGFMTATLLTLPCYGLAADGQTGPGRCPYGFASPMPPETFCVYRGTARDRRGAVCVEDMLMIWSSFNGDNAGGVPAIYVATPHDPDTVITAARQGNQLATITGYVGVDEIQPHQLEGKLALHMSRPSSGEASEHLIVSLSDTTGLEDESADECTVASFDGTFSGLMSPLKTTALAY